MTEPVTIGSYVIYTGIDNDIQLNCNPIGWFLFASNEAELSEQSVDLRGVDGDILKAYTKAGWVPLDYMYDSQMGNAGATPYGFEISEANRGSYKHYCWVIVYPDEQASTIQVNGMKLYEAD